ncbi:HUTI imidazolonepropionase, partial [Polyodon spathula]|nr:HUTI imidazolonepropionase [Polyodon spathula]
MSEGELHFDNIDVFCEKGVFDLKCTRAILQAGKDMGLQINFHGDELHPKNSAEVREYAKTPCESTVLKDLYNPITVDLIHIVASTCRFLRQHLCNIKWEHLIYQFGGHQELIKFVIVKGKVVYENKRTVDY